MGVMPQVGNKTAEPKHQWCTDWISPKSMLGLRSLNLF